LSQVSLQVNLKSVGARLAFNLTAADQYVGCGGEFFEKGYLVLSGYVVDKCVPTMLAQHTVHIVLDTLDSTVPSGLSDFADFTLQNVAKDVLFQLLHIRKEVRDPCLYHRKLLFLGIVTQPRTTKEDELSK
jgi:hypothetical protein